MKKACRGFLALVGDAAIGGPVLSRASFAQPTLILPPVRQSSRRQPTRRFACLAGPDWPINRERVNGFQAGLAEAGVTEMAILPSGPDCDGSRMAFLVHARALGTPDAVFCVTDTLAFGVLDCCRFDLGLAVSRDLSVVGFDDVAEAAHQRYELTTVRQAIGTLATAAVEMLARRMEAPHRHAGRVLLPGVLVERGSALLGS